MPDKIWTTDEHGNRTWTYQGWSIHIWASGPVDCEGPYERDIEYDEDDGTLTIVHNAPYDGSVGVRVPAVVMVEFLRVQKIL